MDKPPYFPQAYPYSCVPACIRMVLATYEFEISEAYLRQLCECEEDGTTPSNAIRAIKECGFEAQTGYLNLNDLRHEIDTGIFPICYLKIQSDNHFYNHAVVVLLISDSEVTVNDPLKGEHKYQIEVFDEMLSGKPTIVIGPQKIV